jgi:RNA polymerase sigma factor (sigma-70 family)
MSRVITNNKDADELLQDLILKIIENKIDNSKINDNYIFISLKRSFMNKKRKQSNKMKNEVEEFDVEDIIDILDIESIIDKNIEDQQKLDLIATTILSLPSYDMKLYQLHFIWGLSQRDIAKKIGVSHMTINMRVNKIKGMIQKNYKNKYSS